MAVVRPFRGVRPADALADRIIALPYDVMNRAEARQMLAEAPDSFLRVTRSDALLPDSVDQHGPEAYARARAELEGMLEDGRLVQDDAPCFYLYRQTWRGQTQTGLMSLASVAEYDAGTVKKHELTRPKKEQDRVDHVTALGAQTGLVFLAWRDDEVPACRRLLAELASRLDPAWSVATPDGVTHALTPVTNAADIAAVVAAFAQLDALYIADGHHRSASSALLGKDLRTAKGNPDEELASDYYMACLIPEDELKIFPFHRGIKALSMEPELLIEKLKEVGVLEKLQHFREPATRFEIGVQVKGISYMLNLREADVEITNPVEGLAPQILFEKILQPILGIQDEKTDPNLTYFGGPKALESTNEAMNSGRIELAFSVAPISVAEVMDVADANLVMPPKSTWVEPKMRSGMLVYSISEW